MILTGIARLGKDAIVRVTTNGKAVASLSLAYNYGLKDGQGNRPTQWVDATLWGVQAERLQDYLLKGTLLDVTCRDVHIETYEGRNGTGHKLVGTIADLEFVPGQRSEAPAQPKPAPKQEPAASPSEPFGDMDDDLPF
jgi:single-strand DNA-binding protein